MKMPEVVNDDVVDKRMMKYTKAYINKISGIRRRVYICMYRSCVCICIFYIQSLTELSFFALLSRLSVLLNHTRYNIISYIYNV